MKIEVGSFFTRGGKRATVQKLTTNTAYPYEGKIEEEDLDQEGILWNREGFYINRNNPDENDLVAPRKEIA